MSKIYEALIKAGNGNGDPGSHKSKKDLPTAHRMFKSNGHSPTIDFELEPIVEEQYQKLRRHLIPGSKESPIKIVMVAATDHGEGGTTTASILAATLSKSKDCKILLVDANLRTPALDHVFNGQVKNVGLSDLILSNASLEDSIYRTNLSNLFV